MIFRQIANIMCKSLQDLLRRALSKFPKSLNVSALHYANLLRLPSHSPQLRLIVKVIGTQGTTPFTSYYIQIQYNSINMYWFEQHTTWWNYFSHKCGFTWACWQSCKIDWGSGDLTFTLTIYQQLPGNDCLRNISNVSMAFSAELLDIFIMELKLMATHRFWLNF